MKDYKPIIAKNIARLRQANNMTQFDLAEKLNYSDKAVSKWERGESMPDISVLIQIANLFEVTLDELTQNTPPKAQSHEPVPPRYNRAMITGMCILLVWLIALFIYVVLSSVPNTPGFRWLSFAAAVPVTMIVWLIFNSIWFNRRRNYWIISGLMWSVLALVHLSLLPAGINLWLAYLLGIPGQLIIFFWSKIKNHP